MFIKRVISYLLLAFVVISSACIRKDYSSIPTAPPINYPDKDLQEIMIEGEYLPKDKKEINHEENDEESTINLDEAFRYIGSGTYCYNKETNKEPVLNENLRARLYDKEGNLLTKDFLRRTEGYENSEAYGVITYLPYHKDGHEIRIIRLEDDKEIIDFFSIFFWRCFPS